MKTAFFSILVALLIVLGVAKSDFVSAQSNPGSLQRTVPMFTPETYTIPIYCDGIIVDVLTGNVTSFCRMHYEDGVIVWMIHNIDGILKSTSLSGEVFEFTGVRKIESGKEYTLHANIKGNQGSHYIILYSVNIITRLLTIEKAVCPGND
jgi:hypothetical protein